MEFTTLKRILPNAGSKVLLSIYVMAVAWTIYVFAVQSQGQLINNLYGLILGLIPLVGGLYGLRLAKLWGAWTSTYGKSVIFLSLGLLSWSIGNFIFAGYYNLYANVAVPYPSLADAGYILALPLWGIGLWYLSRATGAKLGLRDTSGKFLLFLIPVAIIALSYYLLIVVGRAGMVTTNTDGLKIFFDLAYPMGDVVMLTGLSLIYGLSYKLRGGIFRMPMYIILIGFIWMYLADFSFSYTTTLGTYFTADWVDFLFTTAMAVLSVGISMLDPRFVLEANKTP